MPAFPVHIVLLHYLLHYCNTYIMISYTLQYIALQVAEFLCCMTASYNTDYLGVMMSNRLIYLVAFIYSFERQHSTVIGL